jgi:hypothetical protein
MEKALKKGLEIEGGWLRPKEKFNFHDLKAKGITDHTENHRGA